MDDIVYQCPECNFNAEDITELDEHLLEYHSNTAAKNSQDFYNEEEIVEDDQQNFENHNNNNEEDDDILVDNESYQINQNETTYNDDSYYNLRKSLEETNGNSNNNNIDSVPNSDNHYGRQYNCKQCGYLTNNPRSVLYHRKDFHGEKINIYECSYCQYASQYSGKVERHTLSRHKIEVNNSPRKVANKSNGNVTNGITSTSSSSSLTLPIQLKSKPNTNNNFEIQMDYNNETNNHNNNGITEPIVSILEEEEDEILNDDHQEQQHQEYIQEYKCPYCTYTNTNMNESNEYVEHVRDHLNGKSFRCVLCNLMYKYRGDCVVHLKRKHSNIDLQAHNYVEQFSLDTVSPTQIYLLLKPKQQVDEDNDEKLFACSYCDYRANYKGDIFKHHSRKHPNQPRNIISLNSTNNNNNKSNLNDTSYFDQSNNNLNDTSYFDTTTNNLNNTTYNTTNNFDEDELIDEQQHQDEIIEHDQIEGEEYGENDENMFDYNDNPIIEEDEQQHQEQNHQQSMNNNNNQLQCTFCSYIGRSYAKLQLHLATHYNLKKFMCPICNKRANFKWDVQKHIRKVHNDNVSQVICLSEPEARESINSYVKVVNRSQSQLAPSTPNQQTSVVSENVSPTKQLISLNGNTKNKFKCSLCSKTSSWQWDIRKHMREMHKNQICDLIVLDNNSISNNSNSQPTPTSFNNQSICTDATGNKKFKCTLCPYRSNWKADLFRHLKKRHQVNEPQLNNIIILEADYASNSLQEYEKTHGMNVKKRNHIDINNITINNLFQTTDATTTSSSSTSSSLLNNSLPVKIAELNIKPYKCAKCGFRSDRKADALKHIRIKHSQQALNAIRLLIVMQIDEAKKTINDYENQRLYEKVKNFNSDQADLNIYSQLVMNNNQLQSVEPPPEAQIEYYKCPYCIYKIEDKFEMRKHLDAHLETRKYLMKTMYQCSKCLYESKWRYLIKKHITLNHSMQKKVFIIKKVAKTLDKFEDNDDKQPKVMLKKEALPLSPAPGAAATTTIISNNNNNNDENKISESVMLTCTDGTQINASYLVLNAIHNQLNQKKEYFCQQCPYRTCNYSNLKQHLIQHRYQDGYFKCRYCIYYVKLARLLKQHELLHPEFQ